MVDPVYLPGQAGPFYGSAQWLIRRAVATQTPCKMRNVSSCGRPISLENGPCCHQWR